LKKYKSPGSDQIPAELIQAGGEILLSAIHKLCSVWNKEEFPDQWKKSIIVAVQKKGGKMAVIIIVVYHHHELHTTFNRISSSQG
jgi:hypothetical protein